MSRNVVIFSDGTGNRGGVLVDEQRSNIYKLFRATRCGPDSHVDPARQVAFYDAGIGTLPAGTGTLDGLMRRIYNLISQALGIGLTKNIIDCYAAILRLYRPGDDIYLFGFSRGAYTVRCLAAVIALCGIPTKLPDGGAMRYDDKTTKRIARKAVRRVYQHTSSWRRDANTTERQRELLEQRAELGRRFRRAYGSSGAEQDANVYPYFIGVFDTVASLSNPVALAIFIGAGLGLAALVATAAWFGIGFSTGWFALGWLSWLVSVGAVLGLAIMVGLAANFAVRFRSEIGLERRHKWRFFHLTETRLNFYDKQLNRNVGYARHALSIDESRTSFKRVEWGDSDDVRAQTEAQPARQGPQWLEQLWFAGNHSDIGGSYPEDESRLSDIPLAWMLETATAVGLVHDCSVLRLHPDPAGPQHDETRTSWVFGLAPKRPRKIGHDFPLHPSVIKRFEAAEVLVYDQLAPYRPANLRGHDGTTPFYSPPA